MRRLALRKATPGDSEFAYLTKRAAFREYVERVWGWDEDEQRRLHARRFEEQDFRIIVVDDSDVGFVAMESKADCVKVDQLFLRPEHQSKGIGRQCMALIREEAGRSGLPVRLSVMKVNPRARAFYERLGLSVTGETETHDLMEWTNDLQDRTSTAVSHPRAWVAAGLSFVLALVLLAPILALGAIVLAGPHSDLLPGWMRFLVLVLAWAALFAVPLVVAKRVYAWRVRRAIRTDPLWNGPSIEL